MIGGSLGRKYAAEDDEFRRRQLGYSRDSFSESPWSRRAGSIGAPSVADGRNSTRSWRGARGRRGCGGISAEGVETEQGSRSGYADSVNQLVKTLASGNAGKLLQCRYVLNRLQREDIASVSAGFGRDSSSGCRAHARRNTSGPDHYCFNWAMKS